MWSSCLSLHNKPCVVTEPCLWHWGSVWSWMYCYWRWRHTVACWVLSCNTRCCQTELSHSSMQTLNLLLVLPVFIYIFVYFQCDDDVDGDSEWQWYWHHDSNFSEPLHSLCVCEQHDLGCYNLHWTAWLDFLTIGISSELCLFFLFFKIVFSPIFLCLVYCGRLCWLFCQLVSAL